jgi:hypothetical protein
MSPAGALSESIVSSTKEPAQVCAANFYMAILSDSGSDGDKS